METKDYEQGRQYKIYTSEALSSKVEKNAQILGGEAWYN